MSTPYTKRPKQTKEQTQLLTLIRKPGNLTPQNITQYRETLTGLLDKGIGAQLRTRTGRKPLIEFTRDCGNREALNVLLAHPLTAKPHDPYFFMKETVATCSLEIIKDLIEKKGFPLNPPQAQTGSNTLIHEATQNEQVDKIIPWLVAQGLSVNPDHSVLMTPLALACASTPINSKTTINGVRTLLSMGARVDVSCDNFFYDGGGILHVVAQRDFDKTAIELWAILLEAGASPKQLDRKGLSAMDLLKITEDRYYRHWKRIQDTGLGSKVPWQCPPAKKQIEHMVALYESLQSLKVKPGKTRTRL